ncbi:MAG TPA: HAD family hydrolase [Gaiella sp.]|nr:HAD family hydrolase [Gaiella sp.]
MQAFACDLDGTLIDRAAALRPRTLAAIARAQAAGIPVLIATGRMFRSVEPYLDQAGIREPVVCYQGAAVVDPETREFLLHEPLELEVAREAIASLLAHGLSPNVYVDDRLYVAEETEYSRAYSGFQRLRVTEVGDLLAWLDRPPTKLVAVAEPERLAEVRLELERTFDTRLFITTSLPHLLELGHPGASKGSGIAFVTQLLGIDLAHVVAFGDGENDIELLAEVGLGIAVEGAHSRLAAIAARTCPGPHDEGVAGVMEAVLDSLA